MQQEDSFPFNQLMLVFINFLVSLPRMVDFDWRVDIKTSSDSIARMSVPTCILQMKVMYDHSGQN